VREGAGLRGGEGEGEGEGEGGGGGEGEGGALALEDRAGDRGLSVKAQKVELTREGR